MNYRGESGEGVLGREIEEDKNDEDRKKLSQATPSPVLNFTTADGIDETGMIAETVGCSTGLFFRSVHGNLYFCGFLKHDSYHFRPASGDETALGYHPFPVHIPMKDKVTQVFSGPDATWALALTEDGSLLSFGMGVQGQVGRIGFGHSVYHVECLLILTRSTPACS